MSRASHLKVVELDDDGELVGTDVAIPKCKGCGTAMEPCESCKRKNIDLARKNDEIAGLERDIRGWAARYAELERDKAAKARKHPLWPVGESIFREWRTQCRHPRSPWTPDRFWMIEPFLTGNGYGKTLADRVAMCRRAVAGATFDAYAVKRKNGTWKRFDEFERIFNANSGKAKSGGFEEFCNRAPKDWRPGSSIEAGESWTFVDVERAMAELADAA